MGYECREVKDKENISNQAICEALVVRILQGLGESKESK